MHVEVGPLPSAAARAWLTYAKSVLAERQRSLPVQIVASFVGYLEEWTDAAAQGDVFHWEGKAEPEEVEYLLHAWHKLATQVQEEGGRVGGPDEGRVFYNAVVVSLLNALRTENASTAELADQLATFWPGLDPR
ncbi:MAG TPA: hypothetical protein VFA94_09420 [Acidimicrobiales bacterium]|nr:hypothetical protein [Acidimicrobiales bacterium]